MLYCLIRGKLTALELDPNKEFILISIQGNSGFDSNSFYLVQYRLWKHEHSTTKCVQREMCSVIKIRFLHELIHSNYLSVQQNSLIEISETILYFLNSNWPILNSCRSLQPTKYAFWSKKNLVCFAILCHCNLHDNL